MITKGYLIKDLNDWRNGKMGINALTDAIDTYAQQQAKNISSNPPVSCWALFRICEHCNKEYELDRQYETTSELINNFQTCPNCKERDDAWVKLKRKPCS